MRHTLYKDYAEVKFQIKLLEEQKNLLQKDILEDLHKDGVDKFEGEIGKFTICSKKSWKYSKKITKLEDDLKIKKTEEQEKGIAKVEESEYLLFKANEEI